MQMQQIQQHQQHQACCACRGDHAHRCGSGCLCAGAVMRHQAQITPRSRLTDGAVLFIALLLVTGFCAAMALLEVIFLT